jgi:hypothetical protein
MATETVYIVQAYVQGRGKALRAEPQVGCKDAEEARRKAERLAPLRLGVVAFAVTAWKIPSDNMVESRGIKPGRYSQTMNFRFVSVLRIIQRQIVLLG